MATPPDFTAGQVLTAAQMNAIGLWHISRTTIGSAVSSVTVSDAFSADYDSYKIIVAGGDGSSGLSLTFTLGATVTGYKWAEIVQSYASPTPSSSGNTNAASWNAGRGDTTLLTMSMEIHSPFLAEYTTFQSLWSREGTIGRAGGYLDNTTSYTAFTITTSTGTMTGGTVDVYGFRGPS